MRLLTPRVWSRTHLFAEVAAPIDFGLPYQDVELVTPDDVKLRCYLMVQRKDMSNVNGAYVETKAEETDDQVRRVFTLSSAV